MSCSSPLQYLASAGSTLARLDATLVASYADQDKPIYAPVLAPGGLLFVVLCDDDDGEKDEIVALDAQTLQPRYRFGMGMLNHACGLVVIGEELFVCDQVNDRLQVFSLAGEHRRSITGEWERPVALCFVKDRLYLIEENNTEQDAGGELVNLLPGRRICVLSLQGDTLQVFTNPIVAELGPTFGGGALTFWDVCYFDGKLLATIRNDGEYCGVLALRGC